MSESDSGPVEGEPEQIKIMRQMLALAEEQTQLSEERTRMAADRSRMSEERSRMSAERSKLSADRSRMSGDRSRMSADRSELSAERSYMNAERTLSVWVRTALALMVFGIAIDRFGLILSALPKQALGPHLNTETLSTWGGAALIALGVLMAITTGVRFLAYSVTYRRGHKVPYHHGPFLAPFFALLVALFGIGLLVVQFVLAE